MKKLPNLELLLYKAQQILSNIITPDFDVEVFSQIWSNTATGLDEPNTVSGQAITEAYTTVVHERITDTYVVFFDNKPCYKVNNPNDAFMNDLKNHHLKGITEAKEKY